MQLKTRTPQELWAEIEREAGPLDQMDVDGLKRALDLAWCEAFLGGDDGVEVPLAVAKRMIANSIAQQRGQAIRPAHRPRKNWWLRRWEQTAVEQVKFEAAQLRAQGAVQNFGDALHGTYDRSGNRIEGALEIVARGYPKSEREGADCVSPATLKDWMDHPGRRRRAK